MWLWEGFWVKEAVILDDCLFCKIIEGDIPSDKVYEDENVYAFRDIDPKAPVHVLIIPKGHIGSMAEVGAEQYAGHMFKAARIIAGQEGVAESGFRVVMNTGDDGGQTVAHLHMHLLGGRGLGWPPG